MRAIKEEALQAISSMPDNTSIDEIMYRLYVIDKVSKGQLAVAQGQVVTTDQLISEMDSW